MNTPKKPTIIIDPDLDDAEEAMAMRYVRSRLDAEWSETEDKSEEQVLDYVRGRFGLDPSEHTLRHHVSEAELWLAIQKAYETHRAPFLEEDYGRVFEIEWKPDLARDWLAKHLASRWPEGAPEFIATDTQTLWMANRAIDWALQVQLKPDRGPFRGLPVLSQGPTGTGKELLAEAIHLVTCSKTTDSFGAINCGGLSANLLESELFGHKRGAFTDAKTTKSGFVEKHKTIFLDEIGDTPLEIQVRLLRYLNTGEYRPVGEVEPRTVDGCLVVSATHRDVHQLVRNGDFREDLYYRLAGRVLRLRPLAERSNEARGMLVEKMLARSAARSRSGTCLALTPRSKWALTLYPYPGNMRELKHIVDNLVATSTSRPLDLDDLPDEVHRYYRTNISPTFRIAWEVEAKVEDIPGDEARLTATYVLRRHKGGRASDGVQQLRRGHEILKRFAKLLGAEEQLRPHVEMLNLQADLQEYQDHIHVLEMLDSTIPEMEELRASFTTTLKDAQQRLLSQQNLAESANVRHAVAGIGRLVLEVSRHLPRDLLADLERLISNLEGPLVSTWMNRLGQKLLQLSPSDFHRMVFDVDTDVEEADAQISKADLDDRDRLLALLQSHKTIKAVATRAGCSERTIRRRIKTHGIDLSPSQALPGAT